MTFLVSSDANPPPSSDLSIQEITSVQEMEAFYPLWSTFFGQCPDSTPFQSPDWLVPWWYTFGQSQLLVLRIHRREETVAIVPFFIYTTQEGIRRLCFIGSGISDYCGILVSPSEERSVVNLVFRYLTQTAAAWDECDLQELRADSAFLAVTAPQHFHCSISLCSICSWLMVRNDNTSLRSIFPRKLWKNIKNAENALIKEKKLSFEIANQQNRQEFLEELFALHRARWESKAQTGVLNSPALYRFHSMATERLMKSGMLFFYRLRTANQTIALYYTLLWKKQAYFYLGGFDPSMERFSPGTLALYYALKHAASHGASVFDFCRGTESYKSRWAAHHHSSYRIIIRHRP